MPAPQLSSSDVLSGLALVEGSVDPEAPLVDILRDMTFRDWRVVQELVERTLLLTELERIDEMAPAA